MVRRSLFLILALSGIALADTGFRDLIRFSELDNSPTCMAGQARVSNGTLTCSGNVATITTGGSASLPLPAGATNYVQINPASTQPGSFSIDTGVALTSMTVGGHASDSMFTVHLPQVFSKVTIDDHGGQPTILFRDEDSASTYEIGHIDAIELRIRNSGTEMAQFKSGGLYVGAYNGSYLGSPKLSVAGSFGMNGEFLLNGSAGTSGQVLTSAGASAVPTWTTPTGGSATLPFPAGATNYVQVDSSSPQTGAFNIASGTVNGSFYAEDITLTGAGNFSFTGSDANTYQVVGSSTVPTVGHIAVWSSSNAIIDGGIAGSGSGSGIVSPGTFTWTNTQGISISTIVATGKITTSSSAIVGTVGSSSDNTNFIVSGHTVLSGNGQVVAMSTATVTVFDNTPSNTGTRLFAVGTDQQANQFVVQDRLPVTLAYGILAGNTQLGYAANPYKMRGIQNNNAVEVWRTGTTGLYLTTDVTEDGPIVMEPGAVETVRFTANNGSTFLSSVTVAAPLGLGVTYGVLAGSVTASKVQVSSNSILGNATYYQSGDVIGAVINAENGNTITIPLTFSYKAAICQDPTASLGFSYYSSSAPTATCLKSSSTIVGVASFLETSTMTVQDHFRLPSDWTGSVDATIMWVSTITSNNVNWRIATACVADAEVAIPTFNAFSTVADTAKGTASQYNTASITAMTTTGCAAGEEFFFEFSRDPTAAADTLASTANLVSLMFTIRRAL